MAVSPPKSPAAMRIAQKAFNNPVKLGEATSILRLIGLLCRPIPSKAGLDILAIKASQ
jgi:hypothetical protein